MSASGMSREERLVEFMAGCEVLSEAVTMPLAEKADAMRWIVARSGLKPARAIAMIKSYRNRPDDWRKVLDAVRARLEEKPPAATATPAAPGKP
jgi:hypothetical protein